MGLANNTWWRRRRETTGRGRDSVGWIPWDPLLYPSPLLPDLPLGQKMMEIWILCEISQFIVDKSIRILETWCRSALELDGSPSCQFTTLILAKETASTIFSTAIGRSFSGLPYDLLISFFCLLLFPLQPKLSTWALAITEVILTSNLTYCDFT